MGSDVGWDAQSKTVTLTSTSGQTVTDADTFSDSNNNNSQNTGSVTKSRAEEIALSDAGVSRGDVDYIYSKSDYDDGVNVYDVNFIYNNKEYDYEIEASTGKILSYDVETNRSYRRGQGQKRGGFTRRFKTFGRQLYKNRNGF